MRNDWVQNCKVKTLKSCFWVARNKTILYWNLIKQFLKRCKRLEYYFVWLIGQINVLGIARLVFLHKENSSSLNLFYASDCWCVRNLPLNRNKLSFIINYNLPDIGTFDGLGGGDGHWVASQLSLLEKRLRLFLLTLSLHYLSSIMKTPWVHLFFFFFIGLEPTRWPSNNCLRVMACSCTIRSIWVWPLMIFCVC